MLHPAGSRQGWGAGWFRGRRVRARRGPRNQGAHPRAPLTGGKVEAETEERTFLKLLRENRDRGGPQTHTSDAGDCTLFPSCIWGWETHLSGFTETLDEVVPIKHVVPNKCSMK